MGIKSMQHNLYKNLNRIYTYLILTMERINLTLPENYKLLLSQIASKEGISMSELLRNWIKEHQNKNGDNFLRLVGTWSGKEQILLCPLCGLDNVHLCGVETGIKYRGSTIQLYFLCEHHDENEREYTIELHFHKGNTFIEVIHEPHGRKEMWRD